MVMIPMKVSTGIAKFMIPGSGMQALGQDQYGWIVKMNWSNFSFFTITVMDNKVMHCYNVPNPLMLNCEITGQAMGQKARLSGRGDKYGYILNIFLHFIFFIIFLCLISKYYSMILFIPALMLFDITGHKHYVVLVVFCKILYISNLKNMSCK